MVNPFEGKVGVDEFKELEEKVKALCISPLNINLQRGLPSFKQVSLSKSLCDISVPDLEVLFKDGEVRFMNRSELSKIESPNNVKSILDIYNYGAPYGLWSARCFMGQLLGLPPENVCVGGNSSLVFMNLILSTFLNHGTLESDMPWKKVQGKWLCPVPSYDKHHGQIEFFGMELITVPISDAGPDVSRIEEMVANDENILGMWVIPTFSNPTGNTYSNEVVERLCSMETAYPGFKIIVDDAYCVHSLVFPMPPTPNFLEIAQKVGNPNRTILFTSTSKITIPGAGICAMGASIENLEFFQQLLAKIIISLGDKPNQARHVMYIENLYGSNQWIEKHMSALGEMNKPKRDSVIKILGEELGIDRVFANWTEPNGGCFISIFTKLPIASEVISLVMDFGVKLTHAGASFPYQKDPNNSHMRVPFTHDDTDALIKAMKAVCLAIKYLSFKHSSSN